MITERKSLRGRVGLRDNVILVQEEGDAQVSQEEVGGTVFSGTVFLFLFLFLLERE